MSVEADIRTQAIAWRLRLAEGTAADWESFAAWLEASPAHARAYDLVTLAEDDAEAALRSGAVPLAPANDEPARRSPAKWLGAGGGIAAALALGLYFGTPMLQPEVYAIQTGPGEQREIAVDGGTRIALNGGTRIELDRRDPRTATLIAGEARFQVQHDARRPFAVRIGNDVVQDVGTVFNVVRDSAGNRVEVAQGKVLYNPGRENVTLGEGETLYDPPGEDPVRLGRRNPGSIGAWPTGRLSYEQEGLDRVAADLSRMLGVAVIVAPALEGRSFSGTIRTGGDRAEVMHRAAELLDVSARRTNDGWRLEPHPRAAR